MELNHETIDFQAIERDQYTPPIAFMETLALRSMLSNVRRYLRRHVVMSTHDHTAVTLWIAHTYIYKHFKLIPRLFVTSAIPGCGKTTLMHLVENLSNGGDYFTKVTRAYLGRLKEQRSKLTLVYDQMDNALAANSPETAGMLDMFIAGADKGS